VKVSPTAIEGVLIVEPLVHRDERGFFVETWHAPRYAAAGISLPFVQDNHSRSVRHTLRGLHYQIEQPQGKLVRVATGSVFDVAVDLRRSSRTFRRWVGVELSEANQRQLWIPPGCAHGFYVLSELADLLYKCTAPYAREHDRALRWNDPDIGVAWPVGTNEPPRLSEKDATAPFLHEAPTFP
jgi:dTDP-4-dehydrorhamnose 3,5-epimerase